MAHKAGFVNIEIGKPNAGKSTLMNILVGAKKHKYYYLVIGWRPRQPTHIFKSSKALNVSLHISVEVSRHFHINRYFVKN
jgi:ABC-type uncharacterized transport system ATPase subunit